MTLSVPTGKLDELTGTYQLDLAHVRLDAAEPTNSSVALTIDATSSEDR